MKKARIQCQLYDKKQHYMTISIRIGIPNCFIICFSASLEQMIAVLVVVHRYDLRRLSIVFIHAVKQMMQLKDILIEMNAMFFFIYRQKLPHSWLVCFLLLFAKRFMFS